MRIIKPIDITPVNLTYSDLAETDAPLWTAGTYTLNEQRIYDHRVYKVIVSSTTDRPDVGVAADPPTWQDLGATNRYKMFDESISTQSYGGLTGADFSWGFAVEITPGTVTNALAFFNLTDALEIAVKVTDPTEGVVFDETFPLLDNSEVDDWYSYFFEEIQQRTDLVIDTLPAYGTSTIRVAFTGTPGIGVYVGEMVVGKVRDLGVTNFGTSVSIQDYSVKTTDEFGNVVITQRAYSKRADYDVTLETAQVGYVQKLLAELRTVPTVYIGDEDREETVVYGFYKSFNIVLSTPSISDCSIEVEGLI